MPAFFVEFGESYAQQQMASSPIAVVYVLRHADILMDAQELIATVTDWSYHDSRVIAAGVCGSYARGEARPDSDIDFCILTKDPKSLLDDFSWIRKFGSDAAIGATVEDYNLVQSVRVFFGSTEAEFGITDEAWAELPIDSETAGVINDGLRILYDPEDRLKKAAAFAATIRDRKATVVLEP